MTDIKAGDLIATRSESFVGRAIRFGERVNDAGSIWRALRLKQTPADHYNHIAVYVGGGKIVEALAGGLTMSDLSKYDGKGYLVLPMPDMPGAGGRRTMGYRRFRALAYAFEQYERKDHYGWLSIASIAVHLLTPLRLSVSWGGAVICSAFGAQVWEHAGVNIGVLDTKCTLPSELVELSALWPRTRYSLDMGNQSES